MKIRDRSADFKLVLKHGDAFQKGLLVANNRADDLVLKKPFLRKSQVLELMNSIKTQQEGKIYNQILDYEEGLKILVLNARLYNNILKERIAFINGLLMQWTSAYKTVESINSLLGVLPYSLPKEQVELREVLKKEIISHFTYLGGRPFPLIKFKEDSKDSSLLVAAPIEEFLKIIETVKADIKELQIKLKTLIKVVKDFTEKEGIRINAYLDILNNYERELKADPSLDPLFSPESHKSPMIKEMERFYDFPPVYHDYQDLNIHESDYKEMSALLESEI
ncbi:hypothetical protein [Priestia megaterium]|uniref:hypothetical protein n=1 Tax=Priestia megaterium TaxID=1404 RepID=UPI00300B6A6E